MPKINPLPEITQADAAAVAGLIRRAADQALQRVARGGRPEANFEELVKPILEKAARDVGAKDVQFVAQKGIIGAGRRGGTGAADYVFNNIVLEFKAPGALDQAIEERIPVPEVKERTIGNVQILPRVPSANREAISEVVKYVTGLALDQYGNDWRANLGRYAAVILDGYLMFFVRYLPALEHFVVTAPQEISTKNFYGIHRLLTLFRSVDKKPLNADYLAADFGIVEEKRARVASQLAKRVVGVFYARIKDAVENSSARGAMIRSRYQEWRKLFRQVVSFEEKEAQQRFGNLRTDYAIGGSKTDFNVAAFFFALSTYYGLLIKLLVAELLVNYCCKTVTTTLENISALPSDTLRETLESLEREGGFISSLNVRNFLEGELFDWYVDPRGWDKELDGAVRSVVSKLSGYEVTTFVLKPEETHDLLKDLYERLIPRQARHDLGEYYTPDWLAQFVLGELRDLAGYDGDVFKRVLDPTCGSGTFLVEVIKQAKDSPQAKTLAPEQVLQAITRNIVGFDLNPLAVLAARANYIIALGDLIRGSEGLRYIPEPITIPIWLTDSILVPAAPRQAGLGQTNPAYQVSLEVLKELRPRGKPSEHQLFVPRPLVDEGKLEVLAETVQRGIEQDWNAERFADAIFDAANLETWYRARNSDRRIVEEEIVTARRLLREMFETFRELKAKNLDDAWARYLVNRFAPIYTTRESKFDFVVGNPPWINWESLPDDYRDAQQSLWKEYGLFKQAGTGNKGTSVRHGAGKKDLSMLVTYVAVDKLLRDGGHIAFVITQTVFKTEAGEGFRRFVIPQNVTYFAPLRVHDFSAFQPFEGATNRTAVFVAKKGQEVQYPVDYLLWRAHEPVYASDAYADVTRKTTQLKFAAEPVNKAVNGIKNDRWLTAGPQAIRALRKFTGAVQQFYQAYEGSNTGGANGVYWLSIDEKLGKKHALVTNYLKGAKRKVKQYTNYKIETELLYPLLRGRDVQRWNAFPSLHILAVQDPEKRVGYREDWLQDKAPLTFAWLKQFKKELAERKSSVIPRDPFYSMYAIGTITFSPYKVVWSEIARTLQAAVISDVEDEKLGQKVVVPDHTAVFIPSKTETEAHYLCALLNSAPAQLAAMSYIVLHPDPHVLTRIGIPKYDAKNETHAALAAQSKRAHKAQTKENADAVKEAETEIDALAAKVWNLTDAELREIQDGLAELTGTSGAEDGEEEEE
ncbi:MAG: hypothetical protein FJ009_05970 [Chloroflexi bacterium]|nr:hypothetical protein [Chloroflexota bacterium]